MADAWSHLADWHGFALTRVELLDAVDSTNAEALRRLDRHAAADGRVLVARRQTGGHGSRGRAWHDVAGRSLALTALLDWPRQRPLALATWLGVVAVSDVLLARGLAPQLKWPNDTLLAGEKVAGVLAEIRQRDSIAVALGIGVNVGHSRAELPTDCPTPPTSLALHGVDDRPEFLALQLVSALDRRLCELQDDGGGGLRDAFLARLSLAGRRVRATTADRDHEGELLALALDGQITLRDAGQQRILHGAHVTALRAV